MLYIKGLEDNVLNLDRSTELEYEFTVVSTNSNNMPIPFFIGYSSNQDIIFDIREGDRLVISIDASLVLNEETFIMKNTKGDVLKVKVIPNEYYTMERKYSFKVTSKKFLNDGSLKLKIFSKVNDEEIGWKVTYDGHPMEYSISTCESDKGEHVTISPLVDILSEFESYIEFTQEESNNKIKLMLVNTPEMGISQIKKVD